MAGRAEAVGGGRRDATPLPDDGAKNLFEKPIFWAVIVIIVFFVLNLIFF